MTTGPRGAALVRDVVARANDPVDPLSSIGAIELVTPADIEAMLHPGAEAVGSRVVATGVAASPGVAPGRAVFDTEQALARADAGEPFVLIRTATGPADETVLALAAAVVTSAGGLASHAAVLARGRGLPAVCGAESLRIGPDGFAAADGTVVHEGDLILVDGTRGEISIGGAIEDDVEGAAARLSVLAPELAELLAWADEVRGDQLAVLANADTAADARRAIDFGADGIGLCRLEHLLLAADGLAALRAGDLAEIESQVRSGLDAVLEAADGAPVTVRLLDLPRHEWGDGAQLDTRERNPMLGVRGVRLAVMEPELYRAQVRGVAGAVAARLRAGGRPRARALVPFVATESELVFARELVETTITGVGGAPNLPVGVMIETPRAALRAGELARTADFVSFGTNDLTQLTLGLSRDDATALLERSVGAGLLAADPFRTIDADGVGELVRLAVERARDVDPAIEVGVCGEHGGDPASIAFFLGIGVDQVSCSPFRVPVARLAAARAVLGLA